MTFYRYTVNISLIRLHIVINVLLQNDTYVVYIKGKKALKNLMGVSWRIALV